MDNFKTIDTINKFISIATSESPTFSDKFYVTNIEFALVPSIIQDFGEETAKKLANIILSVVEN